MKARSMVRGANTLLLGPEAVVIGDAMSDLRLAERGFLSVLTRPRVLQLSPWQESACRDMLGTVQMILNVLHRRDPWKEKPKSRSSKRSAANSRRTSGKGSPRRRR